MNTIEKETSYHKHFFPEEHTGICVVKRRGENTESLIKRFRKKFSKSNIVKELHEKMFFEKPGDKKRRKKEQNIRNIRQEKHKELAQKKQYQKSLQSKFNRKLKKGIKND